MSGPIEIGQGSNSMPRGRRHDTGGPGARRGSIHMSIDTLVDGVAERNAKVSPQWVPWLHRPADAHLQDAATSCLA
jgi:hypothetical protein